MLTLLTATCWYGLQPVYPDCVFFSSEPLGKSPSPAEAHQRAIESGQCEPSRARWSTWTD
ncbi:hypothetical protein [Streptomyces sp. NPDC048349]|uniref:hypothetical protein n=1 Tax=Streptomyces sp. NPDC048349 TaxID=3155486 RepID=UPI0034189628